MLYPGHNYLGPGNPINNGEPVDYADRVAREHDINYTNAIVDKDIYDADLKAIKKFGTHYITHGDLPSLTGAVGLGIKTGTERFIGKLLYGMPKDQDFRVPWGYSKKTGLPYYNRGQREYANRAEQRGRKRSASTEPAPSSRVRREEPEEDEPMGTIEPDAFDRTALSDEGDNAMQADAPTSGSSGSGGSVNEKQGNIATSLICRNSFGPSGVLKFTRSRIMTSWGNEMHLNIAKVGSEDHSYMTTPLVWLPVEFLNFYISQAEYDTLPIGARVQKVTVNVIPIGSKVSFNTGTTNSIWTNSTQTIFGMSAIGLNRLGWAKPRQIKTRDPAKPMKITSLEDASIKKMKDRLWGIPQTSTDPKGLKELPVTTTIFRSLPWYTTIATPAGHRPFADTWPDISKHINIWEFHGFVNKPVIEYSYSPKNGIIKPYLFAPVYGNKVDLSIYAGSVLPTCPSAKVTVQDGSGKQSIKLQTNMQDGSHFYELKYDTQMIEKYASSNPGANHSYLIQPSVHFGLHGVQANAPDDGLNVVPEFINAAAFWMINSEITISFDVEKQYNHTQFARNMQLDFVNSAINTQEQYLQNYHILGYFNYVRDVEEAEITNRSDVNLTGRSTT